MSLVAASAGTRVRRWVAGAWTGWHWTHTAVVAVLPLLTMLYMGAFFVNADGWRYVAFVAHTWIAHALIFALPLVFMVRVADHAVDDGRSAWVAYGLAVVAAQLVGELVVVRLVGPPLRPLLMWSLSMTSPGEIRWGLFETLWESLRLIVPMALGVAAHAQWRAQQHALQRMRAAELDRTRQQHDLASARLLAQQAQVEPAMLFDALARVDALIGSLPDAADRLLADLIGLLRALMPAAGAGTSTVAGEFALVDACGRVTADPRLHSPGLALDADPDAAAAAFAPQVLLPLLRALTAAAPCEWRVRASVQGSRLRIALVPDSPGGAETGIIALRAIDLAPWQERLVLVHGESAAVRADAGDEPGLHIDLPYSHDQGADR